MWNYPDWCTPSVKRMAIDKIDPLPLREAAIADMRSERELRAISRVQRREGERRCD